RSFRWSTDRLGSQGVIGFVVNGSFIDTPTGSGIRKYFYEEFNYIYFFNLRGDQRTQGEQSRREGGKIFDSGSRNLIAIMLLIKDGSSNHQIFYNDIGDYLTRKEKLSIIENAKSMSEISWEEIFPDENNDWINHGSDDFSEFMSIDPDSSGVFNVKSLGVSTNRDSWVYNFSRDKVEQNVVRMVNNVNSEIDRLKSIINKQDRISKLKTDPKFVS